MPAMTLHAAAAVLALALPLALPQGSDFRELLVVDRTAPGRRAPIVVDAIEAQLARGTFADPTEGLEVARVGPEPLVWRRIEAGEDGRFRDDALRGGWGFATVERDAPGVMLLDAAGHRRVYVNGVPRAGDVYGLGIQRLPVMLRTGTNRFLFRGGRGGLRAELVEPPAEVYLEERDRTLPDVVRGEQELLVLGVRVGNATDAWRRGLKVETLVGTARAVVSLPPLAPLSVRQLALRAVPPASPEGETVTVEVQLLDGATLLHSDRFELDVRDPGEKHKRTFVSSIDGSVQYFAVTPPVAGGPEHPALFLSLHGAGVQGTNQAYSYAPKDWGIVVAPTNRRPFGFDWEDWGRLDALEVLALAQERWDTDPRRQYLTGHSMGGHGTWNLGAHLPGTFAAIAPSAGWRDFWSYGTGAAEDPGPVELLLDDAANASRTLLLEQNLLHAGVYVLHGDRDESVPVEQARFMRERLGTFHPNFAYYERSGAGHWWGNACLDWPPLFQFLSDNVLPEPAELRRVAFVTVDPTVNASCHWATIQSQGRSMEPSRLEVEVDAEGRVVAASENVARLRIDVGRLADAGILTDGEAVRLVLDEQALELPWPEEGLVSAMRVDGAWEPSAAEQPSLKGPARAGPFKGAFRHRMAFVFGTGGGEERTRLLFERARLDAEVFGYRGNGSVEVVPDTEFDPAAAPDRSVILYGNASDHALWAELLGSSPVQVREGAAVVGERELTGDDLVVLLLRPHPLSDVTAVAAVAPTGAVGLRTSVALPYFVSGVGYPDWTVVGAEMLETGAAGIRAAGFFGPDWSRESGREAWGD
jgi:hypothetical protein